MKDFRTSILVNKQVPQFVQEDYPKFIAFLEAYYEFLENEQLVNGISQKNDLTQKLKNLRYVSDVDKSLEEFEQNFFNTYANLVPSDVVVDKEFLLKHIFPLYNSKGSEASFKLLFRLLFGKEITLTTPTNNVLRASDGKWSVENILRIDTNIETLYIGDGVTKEFKLAQILPKESIFVSINGVKQVSGYIIKSEAKKIIFDTAPLSGASITISSYSFDTKLITNRQVTGVQSGAKSIIEKIDQRVIAGDSYLQLYINLKKTVGTFKNGEYLLCNFTDSDGDVLTIRLQTISQLKKINIINKGANYNVGDPVIINGPSQKQGVAVIDAVESGDIDSVDINYGGAGFNVTNNLIAIGVSTNTFFGQVISVDSTGRYSQNTINVNVDLISNVAPVTLSNVTYGFPAGDTGISTVIENALSYKILTGLGPVTGLNVLKSIGVINPVLDIVPPLIQGDIRLNHIGAIGRIDIVSPGVGYQIGDTITFTKQIGDWTGRGANAFVSNVSVTGAITQIKIVDGGIGYLQDLLPTVSVSTSTGNNAVLSVTTVLGDGESLTGVLPLDEFGNRKLAGQIKSIRLLSPGKGYDVVPFIDLTRSGNKLATANVEIQDTYESLQGKWITTDSILSSSDRRIQGRDYYVNYSYVISSEVEFKKYKSVLRNLIHPAGMIGYAQYPIEKTIQTTTETISTQTIQKTISGTVNTNSSIYVVGTNTKFEISNTNGVLVPGSNVSVNGEIRTVSTILSNTEFTVTVAFAYSSNSQTLTIVA